MLLFRQPRVAVLKAGPSKLEQVIDRLAPKMSLAFRDAAKEAQERIDLDVLAANIEAGRVGRVLHQLGMETFVAEDLTPTMNFLVDAHLAGQRLGASSSIRKDVKGKGAEANPVRLGAGTVTRFHAYANGEMLRSKNGVGRVFNTEEAALAAAKEAIKAPLASTALDFKATNPKALLAAEKQAAELLTSINLETKQTIRDLIARSYREQISPKATARMIRDVVGLNDRQSTALFNYRSRLMEDGRALDQVERMTERYGDKLLRQRADTIAQTEIHRASVTGQKELWREGVREGYVAGNALRIWIANSGACDWCEGVEALNADGVPIDGQYETLDGDMIDGPEDSHVGCRCSEGLKTE